MSHTFSRREILKLSGVALGSSVVWPGTIAGAWSELNPPPGLTQQNTLFKSLKHFYPGEQLNAHEMRISFLGTSPVLRRAQQGSSVFVELGNGEAFVFDCGSGVMANYAAMQIPMSKMRKVFLTHLHGDHTSDLTHLYCFGPQQDGKSPLYIWGPSASGVEDPSIPGKYYDDGTLNFCWHFREMNRWHTESQSFVATRWKGAEGDGYEIIATELNWRTGEKSAPWNTDGTVPYPNPDPGPFNTCTKPDDSCVNPDDTCFNPLGGVAYENEATGVRISFFPVVHDRNGSIGYKLEWLTEGLSMIFTGDTKPNDFVIEAAKRGVSVLIHETVVPPEVWSVRQGGLPDDDSPGVVTAAGIQENSHTPQTACGYILSQIAQQGIAPRLAVVTHFQATDDTIGPALESIRAWYRQGEVTFATDLMVLNVSKDRILKRKAVVSDYAWTPPVADARAKNGTETPKYYDLSPDNPYAPMAPLKQFSQCLLNHVIDPCVYDTSDYACTHPYSPSSG